jgi:hypothetical protein
VGPHRALAQIDLFETRPRGRRVVIEQRALRDREPDRTLDVARDKLVASQASRDPSRVTWLPRCSATTPSRRSIKARFWPYWPNSMEASRLSSKLSTTCVTVFAPGTSGEGMNF